MAVSVALLLKRDSAISLVILFFTQRLQLTILKESAKRCKALNETLVLPKTMI